MRDPSALDGADGMEEGGQRCWLLVAFVVSAVPGAGPETLVRYGGDQEEGEKK